MKLPARRLIVPLAVLIISSLCAAQQTSFAEIANGAAAPSTVKIADLTSDYKAMRLHSAGEPSQGIMSSLSGIMMMASSQGGGQGADKTMSNFLQIGGLADLVWTKGQTLNLAGHDFLICYRLNTGFDPASMGGQSPKLAANLTLNLIRTDAVISVAPESDMTPDQLRKVLKSAGASLDVPPLRMQTSGDEAVTAAILFPVFAQARSAAQHTAALSNAKQIALAMLMYANDYDDQFPYVESTNQVRLLTNPYTRNDDLWNTKNPNGGGFRFAMNLGGVNEAVLEDPARTPMIYESNPWPDGKRAVAFADGHAKRVTADEWAVIEPKLKAKYPRAAKKPIKNEAQ